MTAGKLAKFENSSCDNFNFFVGEEAIFDPELDFRFLPIFSSGLGVFLKNKNYKWYYFLTYQKIIFFKNNF